MTKFTKFSGLCAAALTATALLAAPSAQALTIKLGHLANKDNIWNKASLKFADEVKELTKGKVTVEVYPDNSLGDEMDLLNGMQLGTADMTITGESLQNWAPMAALLALPYAYTSLHQMDAVASGPIGKEIEKQILDKAGIRVLAYFPRGPRELTSNRPIKTPEDLKGIKMRVPNVPLFLKVWKALGANPTPMAFSEVFTSLQNGTIEAQENPLALIRSANFNEVQKYVNETDHVRSWIYLAISEITWNKMTKDEQAAVQKAATDAAAYERNLFVADEAANRKWLEQHGMTFVKTDEAAFAAKAKPAVIESVSPELRPTVEKIFAMQKAGN